MQEIGVRTDGEHELQITKQPVMIERVRINAKYQINDTLYS